MTENMEFTLKLKLKKNDKPKSEKSPHYWVDADGMRGVAWDAIDERTGAKGVSIRIFREVKEEPTVQVSDSMLNQSQQLEKDYTRLTEEAPSPDDIPF